MARKQAPDSHFSVEWLDAVARWAQRQPVPTSLPKPELYLNALVALQFEHTGRPTFLGVLTDVDQYDFRRVGDVMLFAPQPYNANHCYASTPYSLAVMRENLAKGHLIVTFAECINFPLHQLDVLPSPDYPAWRDS